MLVRVLGDLLGAQLRTREAALGRICDLYFDRDCWQVSYLLAGERDPALLVSAACVLHYAPGWLDGARFCSARAAAGCQVVAADGPAGVVTDLLVDTGPWSLDYVVASTREPLGPRRMLLPLHWAAELDCDAARLRMRCTRAQLRSAKYP